MWWLSFKGRTEVCGISNLVSGSSNHIFVLENFFFLSYNNFKELKMRLLIEMFIKQQIIRKVLSGSCK